MSNYVSHLGMNEITADQLNVFGDTILENLEVSKQATINELILPNGATDDYVLTSDPMGVASWQKNNPMLSGDVVYYALNNTIRTVGGQTAADVALATIDVKNATSDNVGDQLVKRDGIGNFSGFEITARTLTLNNAINPETISLVCPLSESLQSQTYTLPTHLGNEGDVLAMANGVGHLEWKPATGSDLAGDVTGPPSSNAVQTVGGQTAANVAQATIDVIQNASYNTVPDTLVRRSPLTGSFSGDIISAAQFHSPIYSNPLGSVRLFAGYGHPDNISLLENGVTKTNNLLEMEGGATVQSGTAIQFNNSDNSQYVSFKASEGSMTSQTYSLPTAYGNSGDVLSMVNSTGTLQWIPSATGTLAGDVTGAIGSNTVALVGGKTASAIATAVTQVQNAINLAYPSTLVSRDGNGDFASNNISAYSFKSQIIKLFNSANTYSVSLGVPNLTTNSSYIFPSSYGSVGSLLSLGSGGNLSWTAGSLAGDANGTFSANTVTSLRGNTITVPVANDTLVCKNTVDTLTNKTLSAPLLTGAMTSNGVGMTLTQTGDTFGTSSLVVCNRTGANGAMVQQNNTAIDLCDIGLYSQASGQTGTLRMEKRSASLANTANITNGELQFRPNTGTGTASLCVGEAISTFNTPVQVLGTLPLTIGNVSFQSPPSAPFQAYTLPSAYGSTGAVLSATSSGVMSWKTTNFNLTGMVTSVGNATTVVTNANLNGECTSVGNTTTLSNAAVLGKVLTGFTGVAGTVLTGDTILQFINKSVGNLAALATVVGTPTTYNVLNQIVKRDGNSGGFSAGLCNFTGVTSTGSVSATTNITAGTYLQCGTNINVGTDVYASRIVRSAGYVAPASQGAFLGWNRSGSSGRTTFGNQQGGGYGGFEWVNYNNSNAVIGADPLMSLDSTGNLRINGSISGSTAPFAQFHFVSTAAFAVPNYPNSYSVHTQADKVLTGGGCTISLSRFVNVPTDGYYRIEQKFFIKTTDQFLTDPITSRIKVAEVTDETLTAGIDGGTSSFGTNQVTTFHMMGIVYMTAGQSVTCPAFSVWGAASPNNIVIKDGFFAVTRLT